MGDRSPGMIEAEEYVNVRVYDATNLDVSGGVLGKVAILGGSESLGLRKEHLLDLRAFPADDLVENGLRHLSASGDVARRSTSKLTGIRAPGFYQDMTVGEVVFDNRRQIRVADTSPQGLAVDHELIVCVTQRREVSAEVRGGPLLYGPRSVKQFARLPSGGWSNTVVPPVFPSRHCICVLG